MKVFPLIFVLFLMGCTTSVKLIEVKLRPESQPIKNIVDIYAQVRNAYQYSCTQDGALFQLQDGHWKEIKNEFEPRESAEPFVLDGKFFSSTRWGEGCDVVICKKAYPGIGFDLAEYKKIGEEPNPEFEGQTEVNGWRIPKAISVYKTKLLNGRFKARYDYYTDSGCRQKASREIEFDVP